jgi:hypothetical protein
VEVGVMVGVFVGGRVGVAVGATIVTGGDVAIGVRVAVAVPRGLLADTSPPQPKQTKIRNALSQYTGRDPNRPLTTAIPNPCNVKSARATLRA